MIRKDVYISYSRAEYGYKHLYGAMGVFLSWVILWFFVCPVPALAMDKMTVPISKQSIFNTPDGRIFKKKIDRLKSLKRSAQEMKSRKGADSDEFRLLAEGWKQKKQKFKQSKVYRRVQRMREALGHKVTCYGSCDPEVFVTNALNQIADTGRVPASMHCIGSDPCRDTAPTDADFARAGYSAYKNTATPVGTPGNSNSIGECQCRDSEGGYWAGLGTACYSGNPLKNRNCYIGPDTMWEEVDSQ